MFGNLKDRFYDVQHDLTQGYVLGVSAGKSVKF